MEPNKQLPSWVPITLAILVLMILMSVVVIVVMAFLFPNFTPSYELLRVPTLTPLAP